ncbi:MAG: DDE-type integrase/transposase/recombinase [Candidatus Synoicihabitans palmerolidicus]|nr:DDE-type integrase/transposase/recombinase [Candidatus Synoicihabitans palmerolidicus]
MGLTAIYQKPSLSKKAASHQIYPYLLRTMKVERSNQGWATDITYIPVCGGFVYLCAVIDWHSRMVLAWELSNTRDASFCERCSARWRFTASRRSSTLTKAASLPAPSSPSHCWAAGVRLSMDGKGRCLDNVLVERLWRRVKYEEVYLKRSETMVEAHANLETYLLFYNDR